MTRENQTPAEREIYAENARARNRLKMARRRAAKKAAEKRFEFRPEISRTCPAYRRRLPPLPEITSKAGLREFLARAVQNTEGAR